MHILFIAQQWAPEHGVPQRRGTWMVSTLVDAGHSVDVVAPPPHYPGGKLLSDAPEDQAGSVNRASTGETVYRSKFVPHSQSIYSRILDQGVVSASSITTAMAAARNRRPDVILATAPPLPTAFTAFAVAKRLKVPYVIDLRDAWPELVDYIVDADAPMSKSIKGHVARMLKTMSQPAFKLAGAAFGGVLKRSAGVISTSQHHATSVEKVYAVPTTTVSNLPIVSLPSLVASEAPESDRGTNPDSQRADEPLRVLYSGTVGRAQSLETAVQAAQIANEQGAHVRLRIVGDGAHLPRIRQMAQSMPGLIECHGRVPGTEMPLHYAWADSILVSLRSWAPLNMTVPSKIFEAIGTGKHVTGSLNGEGGDIILNAGAGHVVPAEDPHALASLWQILANDRSKLSMNANGRAWLDHLRTRTQPAQTLISFLERASHA